MQCSQSRPIAAVLAAAASRDPRSPLLGFFVRKETRTHGLGRRIEGGFEAGQTLAVLEDTALASCGDIEDLDDRFQGVTTIVETWFTNYKGPGKLESQGFADRARALEILQAASKAFEETSRPQE